MDVLLAERFLASAHTFKTLFSISYLLTEQFQFETVKKTSVDLEFYALDFGKSLRS